MASNAALSRAKDAKKDEFYTQYEDIQNELNHYEKHFPGKTVLCNCDDPFESNFCKFFLRNFNYLKLKRLICTSYTASPVIGRQLELFDDHSEKIHPKYGYVMDVSAVPMENGRGVSDSDIEKLLKSKESGVRRLQGDGDFRSEECIEYLKQADIVVTNPPFSLFREYITQLIEYEKDFLIIGNQNAITYKEIFHLIMKNKIWLGWKFGDMAFRVPEYSEPRPTRFWIDETGQKWRSLGTICWYTNLDHDKRHEKIVLYKKYYGHEKEYPKFDNYDAINVDRVADIPCDYFPQQVINDTGISDRQTDRQTDYRIICKSCQEVSATELWESPLPSSTNTTRNNSRLSDLQQETSGELQELYQKQERTDHISEENSVMVEYSSGEKCSGVMGVPITFLDKYNPEQFDIIGISKTPLGNHLRTKVYNRQRQFNLKNENIEVKTVTKLNDGAALCIDGKPSKYPYYCVDEKYYIAVYPRILIKRRTVK